MFILREITEMKAVSWTVQSFINNLHTLECKNTWNDLPGGTTEAFLTLMLLNQFQQQ